MNFHFPVEKELLDEEDWLPEKLLPGLRPPPLTKLLLEDWLEEPLSPPRPELKL